MIKRKRLAMLGVGVLVLALAIPLGIWLFMPTMVYDAAHLRPVAIAGAADDFTPVGAETLNTMTLAAQADGLSLFVDKETGMAALREDASGMLMYFCPPNAMEDPLANAAEKQRMNTMLTVHYYDSLQRESSFSSYADSVLKQQVEICSIDNGVRIVYTMGEMMTDAQRLPKYITAERMEEKILAQVDDEQRAYFARRYTESKAKPGFLELMSKYETSDIVVKKMAATLEAAGYTMDDLQADNEAAGHASGSNKPYVVVPLVLQLEQDRLLVQVDAAQIECPDGVRVSRVELLPFFGAGSTADEGYMLVPSGCGALIDFNNGKHTEEVYNQPVYGVDAVAMPEFKLQNVQTARLPVYGIKTGGVAAVVHIRDGAALATITADVSGRRNSYNNVYARFQLRSYEKLSMSGVSGQATDMTLVEKDGYDGLLTLEISLLSGAEADASGVARAYRALLVEKELLTERESPEQAPFYVTLLGAAQRETRLLGYPHNTLTPLTTVAQAEEIITRLGERGIHAVSVIYQGWFGGGVNHSVAKSVSMDRVVGTVSELAALQARLLAQGGALYPDVAFALVSADSNHYSQSREAARVLEGQSAMVAAYAPATLYMRSLFANESFYVNSPNALPAQIDRFLPDYAKLGLQGLALRDLGDVLASDKNQSAAVSRETAAAVAREQIGRLSAQHTLAVSGGNLYALAFADAVVNTPTAMDAFYILDREFPLYQIVLSGTAQYAGEAINLQSAYDAQAALLRMMEYGHAPHFTWTFAPTDTLQGTALSAYHSTYYATWLDTAQTLYAAYSELCAQVGGARMTSHTVLDDGLRITAYENGVRVYVNDTQTDLSDGPVHVPPGAYQIVQGR